MDGPILVGSKKRKCFTTATNYSRWRSLSQNLQYMCVMIWNLKTAIAVNFDFAALIPSQQVRSPTCTVLYFDRHLRLVHRAQGGSLLVALRFHLLASLQGHRPLSWQRPLFGADALGKRRGRTPDSQVGSGWIRMIVQHGKSLANLNQTSLSRLSN